MIIIHAFINVNAEHRNDFIGQAKQVAALSKAEEGNISYHFYEDPQQPGDFVFVESWKDQAAIEYHEGTNHFKVFVKGIENLLREPLRIEVYEAAEKQ